MARTYNHTLTAHLELPTGADDRGPGAAITRELCGHWEHEGDCRWPHNTTVERDGSEITLKCGFDAPDVEAQDVRMRIGAALAAGALEGPEGLSRWTILSIGD